jgi:ectoine hydroxylase-related dioxygenase (phytanoyl-CoA dioxygenase family)
MANPVLLTANSGTLSEFATLTQQTTDPATVPNATEIAKNIPIYTAGKITGTDDDRALMAEWNAVFTTGPGILVIRNTINTAAIDRATTLFNDIIVAETKAGGGGMDHFATPGSNDRIWNSLEKHCLADPTGFAEYYASPALAAVCTAWLGPAYQITAQINRVNPGGKAQDAHRDYHLGFMSPEQITRYPAHVHTISPMLTLQGGLAHLDTPLESGPTMVLPFSQQYFEGYLAFERPEFQEYFDQHHVQLPLAKGDGVFFNPALMHAAGNNTSSDIFRMVNLVQISSAFGRAMENVDRTAMSKALYPALQSLTGNQALTESQRNATIAACAEGYAFPTNLDRDPPPSGHAPKSQADHMREALSANTDAGAFSALLGELAKRRLTN